MMSRMEQYVTSRAFFGHNPVWVVWKADFAVYKNKICLLPLVLQSTREAEVRTVAESRAGGSEVPSMCAVMIKPVWVRMHSLSPHAKLR